MRLSVKLALCTIIFLCAVAVVAGLASADTHVWDGDDSGTNVLASNANNWFVWGGADDVAPEAGDNIAFWDWDVACTWDLATDSFGSFTMASNYSATVTQSSDMYISSFLQQAGTFTGNNAKWVYDSGDFIVSGGTITGNVLRLDMIGTGTSLLPTATTGTLAHLKIESSVTFAGSVKMATFFFTCTGSVVWTTLPYLQVYDDFTNSGSLAIASGTYIDIDTNNPITYSNTGSISGAGELHFLLRTYDISLDFGDVSVAEIEILVRTYSSASHTLTLTDDCSVSSPIVPSSNDAAKTVTLNLNGKSLSSGPIIVGARGIVSSSVAGAEVDADSILVQANGKLDATNIAYIDDAGNWDTSAGSWVPDDCQVNMTGAAKTLKTGNGQAFYYLEIGSGASTTLLSNVVVMSHLNIEGSSNGATFRYNVSGASETCFEANGTFRNSVYLNGTATSFHVYVNISGMASVYSNKTITFTFTEGELIISTTDWACADIDSWGSADPQEYCNWTANRTAAGAVTFNATVGSATHYGVAVNGTAYLNSLLAVGGRISFSYSDWSSHIFILNPSPVFTTSPSLDGVAGNRYYYDANTDEDGVVTYSMTTVNADLRCDPSTGVVQGKFRSSYLSLSISLMADDGLGGVTYQNWTMRVLHTIYIIDVEIVFRPGTGLKPVVHFEFESDCDPELFQKVVWNFGDGTGSMDLAPNHLYGQIGWFYVTCAVYDCLGNIGYETVKVGAGNPEDQMSEYEKLQIWLQTDFLLMVGILAVGLVGAAGYQQFMKKRRGGAGLWIIVIWIAAVVIVALSIGGRYLWG